MIQEERNLRHRVIDGVHFIRVSGALPERARQHGDLLAEQIRRGALPALARKNEWLIRRAPGPIGEWHWLQSLIVRLYNRLLIPLVDHASPADVQAMTRAIAEASGLSHDVVRGGLYQADGMMLLSRLSLMRFLMRDHPVVALPGCSSGVLLREQTREGRLLACRNQDYPVVGYWEPNTTVLFQEPTEPGAIPHVDITTAGVHTGGLTAMNREGITLFAHAHFGRRMSWSGSTVVDLGNRIVENARTLGDAVDIARKHRRHANWAYIITSGRENAAVVLEMTPDRVVVREPECGLVAHSNYFQTEELRHEEANMSGACTEDMKARACRMKQLLDAQRGKADAASLARVLGDLVDPFTGEERIFGNTLGVVNTIKSVVFDPEALRLYVSSRKESPVGLDARYLRVDFERFWSESPEEAETTALRGALQGYHPRNPELVEAVRAYREAYCEWHMHSHNPDYRERTCRALEKVVAIQPRDPNLRVQAGIVNFLLGRHEEAKAHFHWALKGSLTPHARRVTSLFVARGLDLDGKRTEALELYRSTLDSGELEPRLREALESGLRKPYREQWKSSLHVDLQFPDAFSY